MALLRKTQSSNAKPIERKKPLTLHKKIDKTAGLKSQTRSPTNKPDAKKNATISEKTNWNKFKKEKKELKLKRKQGKDLFEITVRAKQIYEKLKCKSAPNKNELVKELHSILRGEANYQKLVLAHDTARIVQCLLKYSTGDIRREISENLIPVISQMVFSKYAHFCVLRMVKYGTPDIKQKVIEALFGNIVKMCCHAFSSTIVDIIYVSWASSQQKCFMRQELYGDLYKNSKDSSVRCIMDTCVHSPHMKAGILSSTKANLNHVVNKKLVDNSLIHSVLLDFLNECSDEDRAEMIATYSPFIPSLASTKDGTRASIICYWRSIVKDRRAIVKSLREHLMKLCSHEHGHMLIIAIVNSMDDTKALKKSIFDLIFNEIQTVVSNEWGRKVIEWFVAPEDTSLFHPQLIAFLEDGLKFSKKDKNIRRTEIIESIREPLCQIIAETPAFWLRGGHTGLTMLAILKTIQNDRLKFVYDKLAEVICDVNWKVNVKESDEKTPEEKSMQEVKKKIIKKYADKQTEAESTEKESTVSTETILGVEHAGLHIVLKKLLKLDQDRVKNNQPTFSASLLEWLTTNSIQLWLTLNRPSFLLLNALENSDEASKIKLQKLLSKNVKLLKKQSHTAAKIIANKLT